MGKFSRLKDYYSDYAIKVFGFQTFGRIYGTIIGVSGLLNFAQSGLDALTHGPLQEDPTPINIFLAIAGTVLAGSLTGFVGVKSRGFREDQIKKDRERERIALIREHDEEYGTMG
jgi:hypothetical protein